MAAGQRWLCWTADTEAPTLTPTRSHDDRQHHHAQHITDVRDDGNDHVVWVQFEPVGGVGRHRRDDDSQHRQQTPADECDEDDRPERECVPPMTAWRSHAPAPTSGNSVTARATWRRVAGQSVVAPQTTGGRGETPSRTAPRGCCRGCPRIPIVTGTSTPAPETEACSLAGFEDETDTESIAVSTTRMGTSPGRYPKPTTGTRTPPFNHPPARGRGGSRPTAWRCRPRRRSSSRPGRPGVRIAPTAVADEHDRDDGDGQHSPETGPQ